ncbi:hypothetical protein RhiirB3_470206 [Rhizophagus irregularis]|nr:hypothetical protein RhiirB3_470206 [Rhizophagus irregularis]
MKTTHSTMPYHKPTGPIAGLQQKLVPASLLRCKRLCSNPRIVLYRSKNSNQPYYETAAKSWYSQAYKRHAAPTKVPKNIRKSEKNETLREEEEKQRIVREMARTDKLNALKTGISNANNKNRKSTVFIRVSYKDYVIIFGTPKDAK